MELKLFINNFSLLSHSIIIITKVCKKFLPTNLRLCELEIRWKLETVHTMELLGSTKIPRKVLWIWEDSLSFNVHNSQLISCVNEIGIWHPVCLKDLNERIRGKKRNAMKNHLKESKRILKFLAEYFISG